ncbi:MAG: GIN domain-containing protein [Rhizomicrobium sp.]
MKSVFLLAAAISLFATSALGGETIAVGPFRSVELRGGGQVTIHRGDSQRVTLNRGSEQYTSFRIEDGNRLVIDACNTSCPNGEYDLRIDLATPDIRGVAIEGGGEIDGAADLPARNLSAAVNGGGRIDMRSVHAETVNAAVSGGGHIQIFATDKLRAAVSGGGRIEYWGNPQVSSAISGGGDVRQGS